MDKHKLSKAQMVTIMKALDQSTEDDAATLHDELVDMGFSRLEETKGAIIQPTD